ncbi:cupin domain-containing protein [Burkholderia stagnalis]|uniref:cupin domain-containing protein n=1 Tax=Burkholderia stagnalis TaxID=1503054 RepID=UPI000F5A974B|nr:cupin domain-containing protein [Burkholderia stagnalis]RQQ06065.1 cupin domain-containing protein [Burkholderia stagnalis]RQQ15063.1 cupin domain-containing protein [Burkholderia stagnalis]RQQ32863.1 cupin domain-containing protein [Burkholderia stagnalis]RQR00146.1 cupin domain-containing protein [Burkholderia stagnalis]RQX90765.1 cupin domain-containing protein [Burkholderia stagnalis]
MPLVDFTSVAADQTQAWKSSLVGKVGPANVKVLRMDAQPYDEEIHDYNEGLLVVDGRLLLQVGAETVAVEAGQMYLALAGTAHAVLPGSHGTLVVIDV